MIIVVACYDAMVLALPGALLSVILPSFRGCRDCDKHFCILVCLDNGLRNIQIYQNTLPCEARNRYCDSIFALLAFDSHWIL